MANDRELDIVVFGATGFVGKLTAAYLAEAAPAGTRIGLAGRSGEKLSAVREELPKAASKWPLIIADAADPGSLRAMAERTRVVTTTVGPYRRDGIKLVEACVEAGTDYADLTGEPLFMRDSIDRFNDAAARDGVKIVHTCGFDSIPSDLGVLMLHEEVKADGAGDLEETKLLVRRLRGSLSGGTLASGMGQMDEVRANPQLAKIVFDPYSLSPDRSEEPDLGKERDLSSVRYDKRLKTWEAPFIMAPVNSRVVRRSNALQGWDYGRKFRYSEQMGFGDGLRARAIATGVTAGLGAMYGGLGFGPTRAVMQRFLPKPGEGPSEKTRREGGYKFVFHADTSSGASYVATVVAQGDPGYQATSVILGEASLCLALDRDKLPKRGGVLTPATAMGMVLVDRLRAAGQTFEVARA